MHICFKYECDAPEQCKIYEHLKTFWPCGNTIYAFYTSKFYFALNFNYQSR